MEARQNLDGSHVWTTDGYFRRSLKQVVQQGRNTSEDARPGQSSHGVGQDV